MHYKGYWHYHRSVFLMIEGVAICCTMTFVKPGARWPGFLKLLLYVHVCVFACMCLHVCVSAPEAINN